MIHWPGFITNGWCNDAFVKGLADCQQQGLTQAIGVSNFKLERVKTAQQILKVDPPPPPPQFSPLLFMSLVHSHLRLLLWHHKATVPTSSLVLYCVAAQHHGFAVHISSS